MKINIVPTIITLIVAVLLAYLFYTLSEAREEIHKALAVSGFASIFVCLECGIGISFKDSHHKVNIFAISLFFLIAFIIEHCCFAVWGISKSGLIITTGLLIVLYLLIYHSITKTKM